MRGTKFRGKRRWGNQGWLHGYLTVQIHEGREVTEIQTETQLGEEHIVYGWVPVDPKTVGQRTGLKDKNDKEIYEGDVVIIDYGGDGFRYEGQVVDWDAGWFVATKDEEHQYVSLTDSVELEVIGNIHENPEMVDRETANIIDSIRDIADLYKTEK